MKPAMTSRFLGPLTVAAAGLLLAACASTPSTVFHTLLATPARAAASAAAPEFAIELMPVSVPSQVDVPQLLVRRGPGELVLVESRQWAAPLHRELRAALSEQLSGSLGVADVYRLAAPEGLPLYRIRINISRFEAWPAQQTVLAATWSINQVAGAAGEAAPVLTCSAQLVEKVGGGYDEIVAGYQRAVQRLGAQIAGGVRDLRAARPAACAGAGAA